MQPGNKENFLERLKADPWLRSASSGEGFWKDADGKVHDLHDMNYSYLLNCIKMLKDGYWNDGLSSEDNARANAIAKIKLSELEKKVSLLERGLARPAYAGMSQKQKMKFSLSDIGIPY